MPVTVLLTNTNWWPCSAHVAMALSKSGCQVDAVYPRRGHPLSKTSIVSGRFAYNAVSPVKSLFDAIRQSSPDLIVPCDDRAVVHLHRLHTHAMKRGKPYAGIREIIAKSLGSPAAFPIVARRETLLRTALEEGIPVPQMLSVSSPGDLRAWSPGQPFPWVMKADRSWGGLGVKVVRNLREAEACFHRMNAPLGAFPMIKRAVVNRDPFHIESWWERVRPPITVQSYIEGHPSNCVVFCWNGKVLAGTAVEVAAAQGLTGPATVVRLVEGRQMLAAAAAIARRLNLSGFHGFDFMTEETSGTPHLIELNPRCAMPCHLRFTEGRDLIGAVYAQLSGRQSNHPPTDPASDLVSYFPQAWLSHPASQTLRTGYHDVPWDEPALVKELMLLPWPDRGFLARTSDRFRNLSMEQRSARRHVFQPASPHSAGGLD